VRAIAAILLSSCIAAGCASLPPEARRLDASQPEIELTDTPFFPQQRFQCGPAALATVLAASGRDPDIDALVERVYLPARRGSLQVELLAATRSEGRIPYLVEGSAAALARELEAGRPVLVLQNLGVAWLPRWHYAVVVGIDPSAGRIVLRSGAEQRRLAKLDVFLRSWQRSGYWGFVTLRPGELPASADRTRYYRAVADVEAVGERASARAGWQAAADAWPHDPQPHFGLGNLSLSAGEPAAAARHYRAAIAADPDYLMAYNNLAFALAAEGGIAEGLAILDRALARAAGNGEALQVLRASRLELSP